MFSINGRTAGVGQYEYIYGETLETTYVHGVWHDLDQSGEIIRVSEDIFFAGMHYQRINDEQRWKAAKEGDPNEPISGDVAAFWSQLPLAGPDDLIWTLVGEANIGGAATAQYQSEVKPGKNPTGVTLNKNDYFIGMTDKFMHKQQTTLHLSDAQRGATVMEYALVYFDFDAPVQIGAPPANLVDIVDGKTFSATFPGAESLPPWVHNALLLANEHSGR